MERRGCTDTGPWDWRSMFSSVFCLPYNLELKYLASCQCQRGAGESQTVPLKPGSADPRARTNAACKAEAHMRASSLSVSCCTVCQRCAPARLPECGRPRRSPPCSHTKCWNPEGCTPFPAGTDGSPAGTQMALPCGIWRLREQQPGASPSLPAPGSLRPLSRGGRSERPR